MYSLLWPLTLCWQYMILKTWNIIGLSFWIGIHIIDTVTKEPNSFPPTKFKPTVTAGIYICPQEISSHFLEWTNVDGISFPSMSFFTFGFFGHAVICFKTLSDQSAIIKQGDCFCHPKDLWFGTPRIAWVELFCSRFKVFRYGSPQRKRNKLEAVGWCVECQNPYTVSTKYVPNVWSVLHNEIGSHLLGMF